MPLVAVCGVLFYLNRHIPNKNQWLVISISFSFWYLGSGLVTLYYINALWASV